jgi:membrane protein implicated in regulation of membrane protease activity
MIEFLSNHILWWHWVVLGLLLILLELQDGSFLMLGLGTAAILMGAIHHFFHPKIAIELILWALLSAAYIIVWKKFIHDKITGAKVGQSDSDLGEKGIVISPITKYKEGRVRFDIPVIGSRIWLAIADEDIPVGTEIQLVEIDGQYAKVAPIDKKS